MRLRPAAIVLASALLALTSASAVDAATLQFLEDSQILCGPGQLCRTVRYQLTAMSDLAIPAGPSHTELSVSFTIPPPEVEPPDGASWVPVAADFDYAASGRFAGTFASVPDNGRVGSGFVFFQLLDGVGAPVGFERSAALTLMCGPTGPPFPCGDGNAGGGAAGSFAEDELARLGGAFVIRYGFEGDLLQEPISAAFGIDFFGGFVITYSAVPETATALSLGLGLLALAAARRTASGASPRRATRA